jgi:hypothetical protein
VGAIDGETQFLPVLIDEEQEHEYIRQNDRDYRNHWDIPYLAATARQAPSGSGWPALLERPMLDPSVRPRSLFTTAGVAAEGIVGATMSRLKGVGHQQRDSAFPIVSQTSWPNAR